MNYCTTNLIVIIIFMIIFLPEFEQGSGSGVHAQKYDRNRSSRTRTTMNMNDKRGTQQSANVLDKKTARPLGKREVFTNEKRSIHNKVNRNTNTVRRSESTAKSGSMASKDATPSLTNRQRTTPLSNGRASITTTAPVQNLTKIRATTMPAIITSSKQIKVTNSTTEAVVVTTEAVTAPSTSVTPEPLTTTKEILPALDLTYHETGVSDLTKPYYKIDNLDTLYSLWLAIKNVNTNPFNTAFANEIIEFHKRFPFRYLIPPGYPYGGPTPENIEERADIMARVQEQQDSVASNITNITNTVVTNQSLDAISLITFTPLFNFTNDTTTELIMQDVIDLTVNETDPNLLPTQSIKPDNITDGPSRLSDANLTATPKLPKLNDTDLNATIITSSTVASFTNLTPIVVTTISLTNQSLENNTKEVYLANYAENKNNSDFDNNFGIPFKNDNPNKTVEIITTIQYDTFGNATVSNEYTNMANQSFETTTILIVTQNMSQVNISQTNESVLWNHLNKTVPITNSTLDTNKTQMTSPNLFLTSVSTTEMVKLDSDLKLGNSTLNVTQSVPLGITTPLPKFHNVTISTTHASISKVMNESSYTTMITTTKVAQTTVARKSGNQKGRSTNRNQKTTDCTPKKTTIAHGETTVSAKKPKN